MTKPLQHHQVVQGVTVAAIHLDCAIVDLRLLAGKLERKRSATAGVETANLRYALDMLEAISLKDIFPDCDHVVKGVPPRCAHAARIDAGDDSKTGQRPQ